MIQVRRYVVPDSELSWRFSRSSGPGGQSVNTTDSRVELVFELARSEAFPPTVRDRAVRRLGERVTVTSEHRSQLRNRRAAEERLAALLTEATAPPPKTRRPTKPTKASKERRLTEKRQRSETKRLRRSFE